MSASPERYRELIAVLRETTKALNAAEDDKSLLGIGLRALLATMRFLQSDPEVLDGLLTRPLALIENAVHDAAHGATVAMFEQSPAHPGKPKYLVRESVQGTMAFALEVLIASDMGTERAANWVATEARQFGIRSDDGGVIVARQIKTWRSELRQKRGPAGAYETYEVLRHLSPYDTILLGARSSTKRRHAETLARALVKSEAATAPRAAPKQTSRGRR